MQRDVLVLVEHWGNEIETITYQMLGKGRELADGLGGHLLALVIGHDLDRVTETLRDRGMDKILLVDEPALKQAGAELQAHVIAQVAKRVEPGLVLIGYSLAGMALAPAVAAKLGVLAVTNCVEVGLRNESLFLTRPVLMAPCMPRSF